MEPRVFGILKDYISEGHTAILRRSSDREAFSIMTVAEVGYIHL